jgi:hypothetical protein
MAEEECKPRRLIFSAVITVGNIVNASAIIVGVIVFLAQGRAAVETLDRGLTELKLEFRDYKREMRDEIREINRRVDGKVDRL